MSQPLALSLTLKQPYAEAIESVSAALKEQGFGVLTRIDVDSTLKEKIGVEFRRYVILGACNPPLAHRALTAEPLVGLMLPCNVTVEETEAGARVNFLNPRAMMAAHPDLGSNAELAAVAEDAYARLAQAHAALSAA